MTLFLKANWLQYYCKVVIVIPAVVNLGSPFNAEPPTVMTSPPPTTTVGMECSHGMQFYSNPIANE